MKYLTACVCIILFGATIEGERGSGVRVVPVESTPEPDQVEIKIAYPSMGEVKNENPVTTQYRLEAFPLGVYSDFPRAREIRDSGQGQSIHIFVDGNPYFMINEAIDDISENEEVDYDQTLFAKIPFKLSKGIHVLRVFPVRSYSECLKGPSTFAASYFYFGAAEKKPSVDLSKAFLTYNQPEGEYTGNQPILLDFYVSNTQLSRDGYKVRVTIDGSDKRILTEWKPYYIYGLKKGSHTFKLEMLDQNNQVIPPLFDDLQRTIVVK